jgi:hypothetical protein
MFLLLLTGAELFACDMIAPDQCETFGVPADGTSQPDDNCICCCSHIVVSDAITLTPSHHQVETIDFATPPKPDREPTSIYHPPKILTSF